MEFGCAGRYAMAVARGYAMMRHRLALVFFFKSVNLISRSLMWVKMVENRTLDQYAMALPVQVR